MTLMEARQELGVDQAQLPALGLGGALSAGEGEGVWECRSPIQGDLLATIRPASRAQAERAVAAAHEAFLAWRSVPAPARAGLVRALGASFAKHQEALASLITHEVGKIPAEAMGEVQEGVDICEYAVGLSRSFAGRTLPSERPLHRLDERWHPLGPVACITAFNFPLAVWAWNAALAFTCGDAVVWKPSRKAPLTALACHRLAAEAAARAGAPVGLAALVLGAHGACAPLIDDPRIRLISATGSVKMGKDIAQRAGRRLCRTLLELGGNNAVIVAPSADLELAVRAIVFAAAGTAGQRCTTLRRLIVHRSVWPELRRRLHKAYAGLPIGDPTKPGVLVGPLIDAAAFATHQAALAEARKAGATVFSGEVPPGAPVGGHYAAPAWVEGLAPDHPLVQRETFTSILYVLPYGSFDEALAIQNGVAQGLSSALFTRDLAEAERFCGPSGSDCGLANLNIGTSGAEIGGAFGGEKDTGGGRESGSDAWKAYMRRSTQTVNFGDQLPLAQGITFGEEPP